MKARYLLFLALLVLCVRPLAAQDSTAVRDTTLAAPLDSTAVQITDQAPTPAREVNVGHFSASPSVGFTYQGISKDGEESEDLQYLSSMQAKLSHEGKGFQFNSNLFLQYGAQISHDHSPKKIQDLFQLSLVPSMTITEKFGLRLFFEVTAETEMGTGEVDGVPTTFLDPLFLYQTIFVGHKTIHTSEDGTSDFELIFGIGYAYQQTYTQKFILEQNRQFVDNSGLLSDVQDQFTIEKGYSSIFQINWTKRFFDGDLTFKESFKSVALTKDNFTKNVKNSRIGSILLASLAYKIFSVDYTMHLVYDKNISTRRQLDQTMVFGLRFDI
ncbi:MAG: hypothetical protein ABI778_01845 [Ignavibacteriota bacterium]